MSIWTTYHSIVDTVDSWVDSANAVDNNIATFATYTGIALKTMILDTPAIASASGVISKVEHRIYSSYADDGVPGKLHFSPRFIGGDGDAENVTQVGRAWSSWFDITEDTNAPGTWAWSDVEALGANVIYQWGSGPTPIAECGSVEIRVTYLGSGISSKDSIMLKNYYY